LEAPKPTPKPEVKKVEQVPAASPAPAQSAPPQAAQTPPSKPSESSHSATVAPPTSSGRVSGTPIQTDIGKLIVVYQPDADPYYPSFSKRAGEQGEVVVRLIIDESGVVEDVRLLQSSSYPRLDRAAIEIGKRYRFKPYLINGSPTKISTNLLIKFNLKNP
jgi:protein TonB